MLAKMREEYRCGAPSVLLLDESGATRRALGVAETGAPTPERTRTLLDAARR